MHFDSEDLRRLARRTGGWLDPESRDSDVVISCRVRLARNIERFPFVSRLEGEQAENLARELRPVLLDARLDGETWWVPMESSGGILRQLLHERNLISRDLAPYARNKEPLNGRAVAFGETETTSVMINEEDHLRLQALAPGFDLELAWQRVQVLDRYLDQHVEYAFDDRLGYLTGCPTNVGTGLRASVMLHLPALGMVRSELEKVFTAAQRTGLAVRGMHGEGSRAAGDLYQISNQVTLGRSETRLVEDLANLVPVVVSFERKLREALLREQRSPLQDRISRSYGHLRTARALSTEAALAHLSSLRLGLWLGLASGTTVAELDRLCMQIQRGHIQALHPPKSPPAEESPGDELEASERNKLRAGFLRESLAGAA